MALPTTTAPPARDGREGFSPSSPPLSPAEIWEDDDDSDDDDAEYQPASEQNEDLSQGDAEDDGDSEYLGTAVHTRSDLANLD
jgi:hypothetical protein